MSTTHERTGRQRIHEAVLFTRQVEREFTEDLANAGWYLQANGEQRHDYVRAALEHIGREYGPAAATHCREHVLPALGGDSQLDPRTGLQKPSDWRVS